MDHFEGHRVVAIASGDEFSIVVDDRGHPWGWGRAEQGQVCTCTFLSTHVHVQ